MAFSVYSQEFLPGKIILANSTTYEGYVKADFNPVDGQVYFKETLDEPSVIYSPDKLKQVTFTTTKACVITFVRQHIFGAFNKISGPVWLQELIEGPVTLYADAGEGYILYDKGNIRTLTSDITFYLKRRDEAAASVAAVFDQSAFNVNADRNFIKLTADYLHDHSKLSERIRDREFGVLELPLVVQLYNDWIGQAETLP
jgi:hypothetical protein